MAALYVDEIARVCEFTSLDPLAERSLVVAWLKVRSQPLPPTPSPPSFSWTPGDWALTRKLQMKQGSVAAVVAAYFDDEAKVSNPASPPLDAVGLRWSSSGAATPGMSLPSQPIGMAFPPSPSRARTRPSSSTASLPPYSSRRRLGRRPGPNLRPVGRIPVADAPQLCRVDADPCVSDFGTSKTQEDIDLERAMSESRAMSGVQSPHETGIVQAGSPHDVRQIYFGPAEREGIRPG